MSRLSQKLFAVPLPIRVAVTLWVVLLVAVSVRVAVSKPLSQTVVPIYLTAAERWVHGANLYAASPGGAIPGMDLYRNPPGVAAAFVPLSLLPTKAAGVVWRLGSAAVFLLGLARFRRAVAPELSRERVGWMFALAAVLVLQSVNNGQVNTLLAGAGLGGAAAVVRRKWWEAAAWFGVGFGLKIYPVAVGMLVAVTAPRHLAARLAAVVAAIAAVPFALQDPVYVLDQHRNFVTLLGLDDRTHSILQRVPRDWTILPRVWLDAVPSAGTSKMVSAAAGAAMAGLVLAMTWLGRDRRATVGLALTLGTVWMTLFGPATESNTYAVLAGVGAWLAVRPTRSRWAKWFAVVGCGLLAATIFRASFPDDWRFGALGPQPVAAALLMVSAVMEAVSARTGTPSNSAGAWATFRIRGTGARLFAVADVDGSRVSRG